MAPADEKIFDAALAQVATATQRTLDGLLPRAGTRLADAMRYGALSAGKKLRPFLAVQAAGLFGEADMRALRLAAAIECVHCYSLIHDDLPAMDDDDLRRGLPTVHRKFDEATAILAGDALLTLAFGILADPATHADGGVRAQLVGGLAAASGASGMVGGQMRDIEAENGRHHALEEVKKTQAQKTGALISYACESGAMLAEADGTALRTYAAHVGLAFQIADDILDVRSTSAALGKATQKDKGRGKATFVDLLGIEGAEAEAQRLSEAAIAALSIYDSRADLLRAAARFIVTRKK